MTTAERDVFLCVRQSATQVREGLQTDPRIDCFPLRHRRLAMCLPVEETEHMPRATTPADSFRTAVCLHWSGIVCSSRKIAATPTGSSDRAGFRPGSPVQSLV